MSYLDPLRLFLQGDKEKASRYVREARRLAFLLLRQTADSGVTSARRRWTAPDQTTIEVIILGQQVTAIINAPPLTPGARREFDDFVVHARTQALPDGIDPEHPQQLIRPAWRTFFYDATIPGYAAFPGEKGTYRRNPDGTDLFPEGVVHAGEIDWRGPDNERISWYGPSTRYWFDVWRQPSAQYGRFIFHLGQVLLDIDQFCIDNDENWLERLVLGAAVRETEDGRWLYMVVADIPDQVTPPVPIDEGSVYFSQNYPAGDIAHAVRRVRLVEDLETTEAMRWSVEGPSEMLLNFTSQRACSPWVFNRQATKATTFSLAATPVAVFSDTLSKILFSPPPTSCTRIDLFIEVPTVVTFDVTSPSMPAGSGEANVAVDYDAEGAEIPIRMGRAPIEQSPAGVYLRLGQLVVPLLWKRPPGEGYTDRSATGLLVACDARAGMAIVDRRDWGWNADVSPSNINRVVSLEFYVDGAVDREVLDNQVGSASNLARFDRDVGMLESLADQAVAPLFWLWSLSAQASPESVRAAVTGLTAAAQRIQFHEDDIFGSLGTRATGSPPVDSTPIANSAGDFFSNNRVDVHNHRNAGQAAALGGILLASFYDPRPYYAVAGFDRNMSYHRATGSSLPALTGVQGAQERYHPIWLLGQPIGGET